MKLDYLFTDEVYRSREHLPEWLKKSIDYPAQIRALRSILGMTQAQLAKRASQSPRLVRRLESGKGDPRLSTLQKTAEGLECDLIVRFVPKKSIIKLLKKRAEEKAQQIISLSKGTATLEEQEPLDLYAHQQLKDLIEELMDKKKTLLWED